MKLFYGWWYLWADVTHYTHTFLHINDHSIILFNKIYQKKYYVISHRYLRLTFAQSISHSMRQWKRRQHDINDTYKNVCILCVVASYIVWCFQKHNCRLSPTMPVYIRWRHSISRILCNMTRNKKKICKKQNKENYASLFCRWF